MSGDRVKLWIDNSVVIEQWSSLAAANPQGTILLRGFAYYDIWVEFKVEGTGIGGHFVDLKWKSGGNALESLRSDHLYEGYPLIGSPYLALIHPAVTCATRSIATPNAASPGHSLELATAGVQAEFTITAKDLYGNLKTDGGERFMVRFTGIDTASGVITDNQDGSYRVLYTLTKSGTYDASIVFGATGISGSPFRIHTQPARRNIGNSPAAGQALTLATAGVLSAFTVTVRDSFYNWQPDPAVIQANIRIEMIDVSSGYKPQVYQKPIGSQDLPAYTDTSGFVGDASQAGRQVSTPTTLDNPHLRLHYILTRSGSYEMRVAAAATSLMDGKVAQSPFNLVLQPNVACSSTSYAAGNSLSLATAGLTGRFTVFSRDEYANSRLQTSEARDLYVVHVRQHHGNTATNAPCFDTASQCLSWNSYNTAPHTVGGRDIEGRVRDRQDGTHAIDFIATKAGVNYLWVSLAQRGGLYATYYTKSTELTSTDDGADVVNQKLSTLDLAFTTSQSQLQYSVKWTGLLKASVAGTYTFFLGQDLATGTKTDRVKLWIDNSLIINEWSSLTRPNVSLPSGGVHTCSIPCGTIALRTNGMHQIMAQIKETSAGTCTQYASPLPGAACSLRQGVRLQLQWQGPNSTRHLIPSDRLYLQDHVRGSPFQMELQPGDMCAATSRVYKSGLSLATAGRAAFFTVQSRDFYDNKRNANVRSDTNTRLDFALLGNASP